MSDKIVIWSKLSKAERDEILQNHRLWLENIPGGSSADLRGADLSSADLSSADLSSADLRGANLRGADLSSADLSSADLSSADLSSADLRGADLRGANLSSADLSSADLSSANLSSADLSSANLKIEGVDIKVKSVYQCGPLGSRGAMLVSILCENGKVYFSTGCKDNVERKEFEAMVAATHKSNAHATAYKAAIAHSVKMLKLAAGNGKK